MAASTERAVVAQPIQAVGGRIIASPFQFITDDDDNLQIVSANALAGVVIGLQGRRLDEKGAIQPFAYTHTPTADRTAKTQNFKFGRGALLNLTVSAVTGTPTIGQTFVIVRLIKGFTGATIVLGTLLGGYVTSTQGLGWPGSPVQSSTDGLGALRTIVGTIPAFGAELSETVPAGARWRFMSLAVVFAASAVAGDRVAALYFTKIGGLWGLFPQFTHMLATSSWQLTWSPGLAVTQPAGVAWQTTPTAQGAVLLEGTQINTLTVGLLAGDQYGAPSYTVEEWLSVT